MLLARRGYRVLLVDKATFPSDIISTHVVWPHGAAVLDRWGLLSKLAATGCPPIGLNMTFDVGPFALRGGVVDANQGRGGFCPRRTVLDKLLVDAAVESGVELRDAFSVESLVWDGDRVAGIRGHARNGASVEERATVVIGADGTYSLVAKAVQAPEYDTIPALATYYYSYFSGFEAEDVEQHVRDHDGVACFPTHAGLTLIAGVWKSSKFPEIRADIEGCMTRLQASMPSVADRLARARREERWVGTSGVANYFRRPYGPGWALVGDAGYEKDPITAQGISDAFIDAEQLTDALDAGLSGRRSAADALADYQATRDERAKPMYYLTAEFAKMEPPPPQMRALFGALHGNQSATNQFFSAITGALPVPQFMNPENIARIVAQKTG
jgi:2-polyprenyl-6-methoxyphenol hydroxylase-like FAD-dependent oxidoreductase